MRLAIGLVLILAAAPAWAHATAVWNFDPLVLVPLVAVLWLYARSLRYLSQAQRVAFGLGLAVLFAALVSPLDALAEKSLSAHMAQHALLVAVAPPLLLLGHAAAVFAWGGGSMFLGLARAFSALCRPGPATLAHGLALWVWHAPAAFQAAADSDSIHILQHLTFFATALIFWRAVLGARTGRRAAGALAGAFITLLHSGLLGALITLAPYPLYGGGALEDQQLAGLIMWVPMGVVYLAACLALARRLVMDHSLHQG
jgi:putative membrane protein